LNPLEKKATLPNVKWTYGRMTSIGVRR